MRAAKPQPCARCDEAAAGASCCSSLVAWAKNSDDSAIGVPGRVPGRVPAMHVPHLAVTRCGGAHSWSPWRRHEALIFFITIVNVNA